MKYLKEYKSFSEPVNEELLGGLVNFFKGMWAKATEEIKKLGKNPTIAQIDEWITKNAFNPSDANYMFKNVMDEFKKKTEANDQDCLTLVENILDPTTGVLGTQGLQPLYDDLLKAFGKNAAPLNIFQYFINTVRNRAIVDYKYCGGPADGKVDPKKKNIDLKDTTHLPDLKKVLTSATDNKKKKDVTITWVEKTLITRLSKYLSEIKEEDVAKYLESKNIEVPAGGEGGDYKVGDTVIYKRDKFVQEEWDKLTDDDKKKPEEGKMKELQTEQIGIKKISKIEGTKVSFEGETFTKEMGDILMKSEVVKAEGQEDLVKELGDLKAKNPDDIKKVSSYVKFLSDEKNKDNVAKIDQIMGGSADGATTPAN